MKFTHYIISLLSLLGVSTSALAQEKTMADAYEHLSNESVKHETPNAASDIPAFNALQLNPSNLLRLSDIRAMVVDFAPFIENGHFTVPRGFAMEVSPAALIYRDKILNIADYKKKATYLAYNTGISIASSLNTSNNLNQISIGLRTTFVNDADKFLNDTHRQHINKLLEDLTQNRASLWQKFKQKNKIQFGLSDPEDLKDLTLTEAKKSFPDLYTDFIAAGENDSIRTNIIIGAADKKFEIENWNANRLDFALSLVAISNEVTKTITPSTLNLWLTGSIKIKKHGQWLVGVYGNAGFEKERKMEDGSVGYRPPYELSVTSRFYAGVTKYKFLTEQQIGFKQDEHSALHFTNNFSIGTEVGVYNLLWLSLYGGMKNVGVKDGNSNSLTTGYFRFDWKLTIPDWVKFRS